MSRHAITRRAGFSYRAVVVILAMASVCGVVAWLMAKQVDWSPNEKGPLMHVVQRGDFLHEIVERGEIESASNVDIRCEVQARGMGGVTIIELISEGTYVKPGDKLVVLDSSALENERNQQKITVSNSLAAVVTAQNEVDAAEIARKEYLEGTFVLNCNLIENKIFVAEEALRQAQQALKYSEGLAKKGYVTDLRVETDQIACHRAEKDVESAKLELKTLLEYTKAKELKQFEANIRSAEARLASAQATNKLDNEQLELIESQIAKCRILAPSAGQVVYANEFRRHGGQDIVIEEGTQVRERQTIIRLPDPRRMQVTAKINEAKVAMVREGMPARIHLDAFTDREFDGVVERVSEYPAPTSFFAANVKEYEAFVRILGSPENLKPGLNAEVRIQIELLHNVLQVPVQAVFQHGAKNYCVMRDGDGWLAREITIGSTNDKTIVILDGLQEGDRIVLGAFDYREKVDLPKLDKSQTGAKPFPPDGAQPPAAPPDGSPPGAPPAAAAEKRPPENGKPPGDFFARLDKNGDGKIDRSEAPEPMNPFFSNLDKNSDGAIDKDEWAAARRMMERPPGPPDPAGAPPKGSRP